MRGSEGHMRGSVLRPALIPRVGQDTIQRKPLLRGKRQLQHTPGGRAKGTNDKGHHHELQRGAPFSSLGITLELQEAPVSERLPPHAQTVICRQEE